MYRRILAKSMIQVDAFTEKEYDAFLTVDDEGEACEPVAKFMERMRTVSAANDTFVEILVMQLIPNEHGVLIPRGGEDQEWFRCGDCKMLFGLPWNSGKRQSYFDRLFCGEERTDYCVNCFWKRRSPAAGSRPSGA